MLTANQVKSIKPTNKKQEVMDSGNPGFGIRVQPSGTKTWIYRYRYAGKRKRMSLGAYPAVSLSEARQRYQKAQAKHREGKEPAGWSRNRDRTCRPVYRAPCQAEQKGVED